MTHHPRFLSIALSSSLLFVTAACGSSTQTVQSPPVSGSYTVDFPSVAAAIATESVQVYVYDVADSSNQCQALIESAKSGATPPPPIVPSESVPTCATTDAGAPLSLPFGTYAVLVVGQSKNSTHFLVGCALRTISESAPAISVTLTLGTAQAPPATSCSSLAQFCGGGGCASDGGI